MPATPVLAPCSVVLLAGGQGQRMGGQDKGLIEWRGEPLIAAVHRLVRPLTDDLIISCNRNPDRYGEYADRLVHDDQPDFPGPFAGIRAGLAVARHGSVLILPCDVPQLDSALIRGLRETAQAYPDRPVMVRQGEQWEPLVCVIPRVHAVAFEQDWLNGQRSPRKTLLRLGAVAWQCNADDPRLANLNTPELLTRINQ